MNTNLLRVLILNVFFASLALPNAAVADSNRIVVQVQVISVPKSAAGALIGDPQITSDPAAVLASLEQSVARRQAVAVANPSLQLTPGNGSGTAEGKVQLQAQAEKPANGEYLLHMYVIHAGQKMDITLKVKLHETVYLGSFDADKDSATSGETGTYLVFARFH
jgi:hypothetical protein